MTNNQDGWEGQSPDSGWEGQSPTSSIKDGWEGVDPKQAKYSMGGEGAPKTKSTVSEDIIRGAKNLAKAKVTESSLAAVGLKEIEDRTIFGVVGKMLRDKLGLPNVTKEQIFQNMETINELIEGGANSGEGKERGVMGTATTMVPQLVEVLASGKGSALMTALQMGKGSEIGTAAAVAPNVDTATQAHIAGGIKATGDVASILFPAGKGAAVGATLGGTSNPLFEASTNRLVENYLRSIGKDTAADQFNFDPEQIGASAVVGTAVGSVVGRYGAKAEDAAQVTAKDAQDTISKDLAAEAPPPADVDASNIRSPYMKPKGLAQAQEYANATGMPGNRELTPTIKNPREHTPIGQDDADMASAMRTAENDAYATEQGWTGQEPGMGTGEVLADVDTAAAKNPYFGNEDQAVQAQVNAYAGKGPAFGEMGYQMPKNGDPVFPTDLDAALVKAIRSADRAANAKGSLEKAIAKAEASADLIQSDIKMAEQGFEVKDQITEVGEKAPTRLEEPDLPLDVDPVKVDEVADKAIANLDDAFLKAMRRKQGGSVINPLDMTDYTGIGFRDLVEGFKKAGYRLYNSLTPENQAMLSKGIYKDKNGAPVPMGHGTEKAFGDYNPDYGDGGMVHFGDLAATHIIKDKGIKHTRNFQTVKGEKVAILSFKDFLQSELKGQKLAEFPDETVKELRDIWYDEREKVVNKYMSQDIETIKNDFGFLTTYLEKFGWDKLRKNKAAKELFKRYKVDDLIYDKLIDNSDEAIKRTLQKHQQVEVEGVRRHWGGSGGHHVRPMFTSLESPLFIRDMGIWYDTTKLIRELQLDADSETQFNPLSINRQVAPDKLPLLRQKLAEWREASALINEPPTSGYGFKTYQEREVYLDKFRKKFYNDLEELGFDHMVYENRAEAITPREMGRVDANGKVAEVDTPTLSLATWKADKLHDWFTLAQRNKESGHLDPKVFAEGIKKVANFLGKPFTSMYREGDWLAAKANHDLFDTPDKLLKAYKPEDTPDLPGFAKNMPTVNQLKLMMDHPWFNYAFSQIGKSKREANVRFTLYADALHNTFKLPRKDQIKLFKTLVDIQDPELREQRSLAEATKTREQFLLEQGLDPKLVPHAIQVLDVLKHAYISDNKSTARVGRDPFQLEPMYFPRAHTGKYNVTIRTDANDVKYATGFDSAIEAQKFVANLKGSYKKEIDAGKLFIEGHRNHYGASSDLFTVLALEHGIPKSIKDIASGIEKNIEVAKRKFELHRAKEGVGGFIGERLMNENTISGRLENDKMLNLLQNRLRSSYDWEVRSKIIQRVKAPLFDDVTVLHDKPQFRAFTTFTGQLLAREMGYDVSANTGLLGQIESGLQRAADQSSKAIDKWFFARRNGYEGGDLSLLSPKAIQETAQAWTYLTSLLKLSLNPPVLAANATAIPLIFLDGARTAAKQKVGQHNAIAAYMDTIAYIGHKDQGATKFMQDAIREGMVEPHISEQYDLAETSNHHAKNVVGEIINKPRNLIEKGTNFTAILYYYNYYKRVAPNLKPDALKQMVYESARSYSGDYSLQAGPMMFSQAGTAGRLMTNFAKWKWNQIGRLADDIKDAKGGNYTPIALNMATQVLVGGIYGTAGVVDYEALRRLGKITGLWDWGPFTQYFDNVQEIVQKELNLSPEYTEWARRGVLNEAMSQAFNAAGLETSPDISGTMRHSSALEAPTVALVTAKNIFVDALPITLKKLWEIAGGKTTGVTTEEKEKQISSLPTFLQGPVKNYLAVKGKFGQVDLDNFWSPGENITHSKFNDKGVYKRSEAEQRMSIFNFRSANENNFMDKQFYNTWLKADRSRQITERVKGILANQDNPELFSSNIEDLVVLGGVQTAKNIIKQIKDNEVNKSLTADEQAAFAMLQTLDPTRKKFMMEQMLRLSESRKTSSGRSND